MRTTGRRRMRKRGNPRRSSSARPRTDEPSSRCAAWDRRRRTRTGKSRALADAASDDRSGRILNTFLVHGALALVGLLFGANYVVAKIALRDVTPLDLVVIRTWGTAALLFSVSWVRDGRTDRRPGRETRHQARLTVSDLSQ